MLTPINTKDAPFYLVALALTIFEILAVTHGGNNSGALIGGAVICLLGWGIVGALIYKRWKALHGLTFTTSQGVLVSKGDFDVREAAVTAEIESMLVEWERKVPEIPSRKLIKGCAIVFREYPFTDEVSGRKVTGLYEPSWRRASVGWKSNLSETALQHELGHDLYFHYSSDTSETAYHEWAKQKGLK